MNLNVLMLQYNCFYFYNIIKFIMSGAQTKWFFWVSFDYEIVYITYMNKSIMNFIQRSNYIYITY